MRTTLIGHRGIEALMEFENIGRANMLRCSLSLLVKAWHYSSWPAYKSRFWNKENESPQKAQARTP